MKILFILPAPPVDRKIYIAYHQGIAQLSAMARDSGHHPSLLTVTSGETAGVKNVIKSLNPDLVGFSVCTPQYALACELTALIREVTDVPVVWGGAHPTVRPEEALSVPGVTGIIRGEGEAGFLRLLKETDLLSGNGPDGRRLDPDPEPVDLDALPFGDREVFPFPGILRKYGKIVGAEFLASRGCPFQCTYCINPYLTGLYKGKYYRRRKVAGLMTEIGAVVSRYPEISLIGFHDDTFTADRQWLKEFCEAYGERFDIPFWCNVRPGTVGPGEWAMLKKAGLRRVHIGIESGSYRIRKDILGRDISDEEILDCFAGATGRGIRTVAFNMIGMPEETGDDFEETVRLNRTVRPGWLLLSVFNPYPGSRLYDTCEERGLISSAWPESYYHQKSPVRDRWMSRGRLFYYCQEFIRLVYA